MKLVDKPIEFEVNKNNVAEVNASIEKLVEAEGSGKVVFEKKVEALTPQEAADMLGVSRTFFRTRLLDKVIPGFPKFEGSKQKVVELKDVKAWNENRRIKGLESSKRSAQAFRDLAWMNHKNAKIILE
ncbi:MAG: hypothetical protein QM571_00040 [Micrococcaceae bacterium]